jgi:hypothetical protein
MVIGILLLGLYFTVFMSLWLDMFNPGLGYFFIFCNCLSFRYYWKRLNRRGWVGVLVGIVVSLMFIFLDGFISAYMRVLSQ